MILPEQLVHKGHLLYLFLKILQSLKWEVFTVQLRFPLPREIFQWEVLPEYPPGRSTFNLGGKRRPPFIFPLFDVATTQGLLQSPNFQFPPSTLPTPILRSPPPPFHWFSPPLANLAPSDGFTLSIATPLKFRQVPTS